jgi:hypothetical protein
MVRQILPNNNENATGIFLLKISDLDTASMAMPALDAALSRSFNASLHV